MGSLEGLNLALVRLRQRAGLSQSEAARRAGIHRSNWARYEHNEGPRTIAVLERMLDALGCTVLDLGAALLRDDEGSAQTGPIHPDLEDIKREMLAAVDQRLTELGYEPGATKRRPAKERAKKEGSVASGKPGPG